MNLAIVSTTINGEGGYLSFDKIAHKSKFSNVKFFIAGDISSKDFDTSKFKCDVEYLLPKDQERFAVSDVIGWRTPRRRPVAYLRAIEENPDFVLTIDDDNIPTNTYFDDWYEVLTTSKEMIIKAEADSDEINQWHNYLRTADGPVPLYPRGYPTIYRSYNDIAFKKISPPIKPSKVGLFQGISLGDPDIESMTRLVYGKPIQINTIKEKNYCLQDIWSPFNTQNTILTKRLFPLPLIWPSNGRFDDIYASYTYQQLLFNNGLFTHIGDSINNQDRGERDIFNEDFVLEIDGYVESHNVWNQIRTINETDGIVFLKALMKLNHPHIQRERRFFEAYLKDISKII